MPFEAENPNPINVLERLAANGSGKLGGSDTAKGGHWEVLK